MAAAASQASLAKPADRFPGFGLDLCYTCSSLIQLGGGVLFGPAATFDRILFGVGQGCVRGLFLLRIVLGLGQFIGHLHEVRVRLRFRRGALFTSPCVG